MKKILLLILYFLCLQGIKSQITFEKTYEIEGGNYKEYALSVIQDDEGRYVVAVYCQHTVYDLYRAEVFRTDQYGEFIDSDVFLVDSEGFNTEHEVLPTSYGGYVLGTTTRTSSGTKSVYSLNFKDDEYQNEKLVWTFVRDHNLGQELIMTFQNTYLLLGYSFDDNQDTVLYLGEYTNEANYVQSNTYSSPYNVVPRSAGQLDDGTYLITGYTNYPQPRRLYVAHISTDLEFIWEKTYNIGTLALSDELPVCVYGNDISIPHTLINEPTHQSIQLLSINDNGDSLGSYIVADGLDIDCLDVVIEDNGDLVMTGLEELDGPDRLAFLLRVSSQGSLIWKRYYTINQSAAGMSLAKTQDGGYIIAGFSRWPSPIIERPFLIKTDEEGFTTWTSTLVQTSPMSISPNPANTSFRIDITSGDMIGSLSVYSSSGEKVIFNNKYNSGTTVKIDHFAPGTYIVDLMVDKRIFSAKLIVE